MEKKSKIIKIISKTLLIIGTLILFFVKILCWVFTRGGEFMSKQTDKALDVLDGYSENIDKQEDETPVIKDLDAKE